MPAKAGLLTAALSFSSSEIFLPAPLLFLVSVPVRYFSHVVPLLPLQLAYLQRKIF